MNNCANCRHHRKEMRPAAAEMGFDTLVQISDDDVPHYFCRVAETETEVGRDPISCELWAAPVQSSRLAELDALLAKRNRAASAD